MTPEQPSILIVDDDDNNRELLARLMRKQYRTAFAVNGSQAMEMMRAQPFDLVLLDIMMPEVDGFQVLEQLRREPPPLRHVPVVVISALTGIDNVVRCIELGAEDYLLKPFNGVLLRARVGAS